MRVLTFQIQRGCGQVEAAYVWDMAKLKGVAWPCIKGHVLLAGILPGVVNTVVCYVHSANIDQ